MKVIHATNNLKKQNFSTVVSVGVFDGVHIGHQKIIRELIRRSAFSKALAAVVTFSPHPAKVLGGTAAAPMLTSLKHRLHLLEGLGVRLCIVINFSKRFAGLSAREFIKNLLIDKLHMKMLVVGEKFSFGRERLHSPAQLRKIAEGLGFKLRIAKPKRYHSRIISSSHIRHLIENGELKPASRLLGRPVSILGTVVGGKRRGRAIGFKTANINPLHEAIPPSGVYAVYSKLGSRIYKSALNIGTRPTFGEKEPTIEAHIFGLNRSIYGKDIEISFKKRLRPERKFKNKEHLRYQILKDTALAQQIL